jgi:hypothetical protein
MMLATWFQWLKRGSGRGSRVGRPTTKRSAVSLGRSIVPRLEALEDRTLLSTVISSVAYTVTNLHDNGNGSLRAAVASGDGTIVFAKGLHGTIVLTSGELLINNSVAINGPGANRLSVSGNNASRVFEIAAGQNVAISGLTITHGYAPDQGGGILNDGSNLTLSADNLTQNVVFESATNGARGGGLDSLSGTLTITECQITGNEALGAAGPSAVGLAFGGGISVLAGSATISNSTISGNLARGGAGSSDGEAGGGGIQTNAPLLIIQSTISDNRARAGDNAAASAGYGGGLEVFATPSVAITDSTFSGNLALGGNGGTGPFVGEAEGGAIISTGSASITGSTFDDNLALAGSDGNSGPGNADPGVDEAFGGAIFGLFGASTTVSSSTFDNNAAIGGNNATATGTDIVEVGVAEGGTICNEIGAVATISGSSFDHNQAIGGSGNTGSGPVVHVGSGFGAGIFSGFGGVDVGANTLTVSGTTFSHNTSQGGDNNSGTASVAGLVGDGVGAGIMNGLGGTVSITGSEFDHNQARGGRGNTAAGAGAVFAGLGAGGGIFNYLGNYNSSGYGPFNASVVTVTNSTIAFNLAQGGGGGNGEGGGIANVLDAATTVADSVLILNQANGGGGAGLGGGAYNDATSNLALTKALVTLNQADGSPGIGGGVYTLGTFTDLFSLILGNDASTSGDNIGN